GVGVAAVAAEAGAQRPAADDAVLAQVALREGAAARADVLDDLLAELARVELLCAVQREQLERGGEIVLDERVANEEPAAAVLVDRARLGGMPQDQVEDAVQVRLPVVELHAAACELDGGLEEVAPRQPAEHLVRRLEPERRSRNRTGGGADVERCVEPPLKSTSTTCIPPGGASSPSPGIATKKWKRGVLLPRARWTSMTPPPPGRANGPSAPQETSAAPPAASTAFPPASSTCAPACAVSACPPATAPRMRKG